MNRRCKNSMIRAAAVLAAVPLLFTGCGADFSAEGTGDGGSAAGPAGAAAESAGNGVTEETDDADRIVMTGTGAADDPVEWAGTYFDTAISLMIYGDDAQAWMKSAVSICRRMENTLSAQKETAELYQVNHRHEQTVEVSDDLAACIREGLKYSEMSDGAFDITILPVKELWDFESGDHEGKVPDDEDIREQLKKVDYTQVHLDGNQLSFDSSDTMIDLGGIAKGYISGKLKDYLKKEGCTSALINLGGNISTIGTKPDGSAWNVGIQKPFDSRGEVLTTVRVSDESVISSGIYERYFKSGGKLYHHILDPRTGKPAETDLDQVTVVGEDDAAGDALATIGIVLGKEKTEQFLSDHGLADSVRVLFTDRNLDYTWYPQENSE